MKKLIKLNENELRGVVKESVKQILNELKYNTVDNASTRGESIFYGLASALEDFYIELDEAEEWMKKTSRVGEQTYNPYLKKIRNYADEISKILDRKLKQANNFTKELFKVDTDKFNDENEDEYYSDKELRDLQRTYPNKNPKRYNF